MTTNFRHGVLALTLSMTLALAAAGCSERVTALLVDAPCRCDAPALKAVSALSIRIAGAATRESACRPVAGADSLDTIQSMLRGAVSLDGLEQGSYTVTVLGYADSACSGDVLACGHTPFSLPAASSAIDIPVRCQRDSAGAVRPITVESCTAPTNPDRCSDPPGDAGPGDVELAAITLSDGGGCDHNDIIHADSIAVALYDGATVRWRRCLRINNLDSLADVLKALPAPLLQNLSAGQYTLLVTAHDGDSCRADDVIGCSGASVTLPTTSTPQLTMTCVDEKTPITTDECRSRF